MRKRATKINYLEEPFYSMLKDLNLSNREAAKKMQIDYNTVLKYRREILSEKERKLVKRGSKKIEFNKEQLDLIADEKVSPYRVANIFGCDPNVIKDRRKKLYPNKDFSRPFKGNFAKDYLLQNYKKLMNKSLNKKLLNSIKFMDNISFSDEELKLLGDENITNYRISEFLSLDLSSVKRIRTKLYPDRDFSKKFDSISGTRISRGVFYTYMKENHNEIWKNYFAKIQALTDKTDKVDKVNKIDKVDKADKLNEELLPKDKKDNSTILYNANDVETKQINKEKVDKSNEEITISIDKKYLSQNAKILISQDNDQLRIEIK